LPVLDGGHLFIMALEGMASEILSPGCQRADADAGFAVILMLM